MCQHQATKTYPCSLERKGGKDKNSGQQRGGCWFESWLQRSAARPITPTRVKGLRKGESTAPPIRTTNRKSRGVSAQCDW